MNIYSFHQKLEKFPRLKGILVSLERKIYVKSFLRKRKKVKLHLGCGEIILKNYVNIDIRKLRGVDIAADIINLPFIPDNSVDEIYTCHTFEHISHRLSIKVLKEWFRILKNDGKLIVSVPDFDSIVNIYKATGNNIWNIKSPPMGEQDYLENSHYSVFNFAFFHQILEHVGFRRIRKLNIKEKVTLKDWSFKKIRVPTGEAFFISLNIVAEK